MPCGPPARPRAGPARRTGGRASRPGAVPSRCAACSCGSCAHVGDRGRVLVHEPRPPVIGGHGLKLPDAAISAKELEARPGASVRPRATRSSRASSTRAPGTLGPAPRAELLHVLLLPDFERADRIGEFWGYTENRTFAELLIDCEEDRVLRAVLVGMLRGGRPVAVRPWRFRGTLRPFPYRSRRSTPWGTRNSIRQPRPAGEASMNLQPLRGQSVAEVESMSLSRRSSSQRREGCASSYFRSSRPESGVSAPLQPPRTR